MLNAARASLSSAAAPVRWAEPSLKSSARSAANRRFLIGCAAIRNTRNPRTAITNPVSNRLYFACFGSSFARHQSLLTNRQSLFQQVKMLESPLSLAARCSRRS
jgi:hypothetical protein